MNDRTMFKVSNEDVRQSLYKAEVLVRHRNLLRGALRCKLGFTTWMFLIAVQGLCLVSLFLGVLSLIVGILEDVKAVDQIELLVADL